jgi:hypothetical protein
MRRVITQTGPDTYDVDMDMEDIWSEVHILFPNGSPIVKTLEALQLQVAETLKLFKPEFEGRTMPAHWPTPR